MKYNINELVSQSIITKTPTIVVEGIDDIPIYDAIAQKTGYSFSIVASEVVEDTAPGCEGVMSIMNAVNEFPEISQYNLLDYIVGIIDKDVKDFRDEIPSNSFIYVLKYYSMESHFVCREITSAILRLATRCTSKMRSRSVEDYIYAKVFGSLELLYVYSLEALRGATDRGYTADISFSNKIGTFKNPLLKEKVLAKKDDLYEFATTLGIDYDIESMRKFVKGKWLIDVFCIELERIIKDLPIACKNGEITSCQYCISGTGNQCLYKLKDGVSHKFIKIHAMAQFNIPPFEYIKTKLGSMGSSVNV